MTMSARHARSSTRLRADLFRYLQVLMRQRIGVVLDSGKEYLAETRLAALAHREGYAGVGDLLESLQTEESCGALHRQVVEAMAITETSFYRDIHPFEALRTTILPRVIRERAADRTLHIWSAACSSGQEPYSIAMMLREHFPDLGRWNVRIVASDASQAMLDRARAGVYSKIELNRGLPARQLVRWFDQTGNEGRLREDIRRMVEFREVNLLGPWPALPPMDIVLMRNVLIYFELDTRKSILSALTRLLRPGAVLFLGSGETTLTLDGSFEPVPLGRCTCYRVAPRGRTALPGAA